MINLGYACLALGVKETQMKSCIMRTATDERLREIIGHNLDVLMGLVKYNQESQIRLFRISSDLIPFGSSPVNLLQWQEEFAESFEQIGKAIKDAGLRVSMHPGQYTVMNSTDEDVVKRAIADLDYHAQILHLLKTDHTSKIILHVGGAYGDKAAAIERFCRNWERLSDDVRGRVVLENDERFYNVSEVLQLALRLGIPVVFDTLHHAINPPEAHRRPVDWILQCAKTWKPSDGRQKIHYSQQNPEAKPGAHAKTISAEEFLQFYETVDHLELDIMLEVKDKNLSAIKCGLLTSQVNHISSLEQEWAKYKYSVLERSPKAYQKIRELLKNKREFPVKEFYHTLELAMKEPTEINHMMNGLLHVWGYFKTLANPDEKKRFFVALDRYQKGTAKAESVKNQLFKLAQKYDQDYLLQSYYFL